MTTITTPDGKEVKTFRNMYDAMYAVEGSYSRGRQTVTGDFILNNKPVTIYHHWSTEGYQVYSDNTLSNRIGEITFGDWFPLLDENGKPVKNDIGTRELTDSLISVTHEN